MGDSDEEDKEPFEVLKGFGIGLACELVFCVIVQLTFGGDIPFQAWIVFGCCMFARLVVFCLVQCCDKPDNEFFMSLVLSGGLFMSFWPFLLYGIISNRALLNDCDISALSKNITTWTAGTSHTFVTYQLGCPSQQDWLPVSLVGILPLIIQLGFPVLFASIFLNIAELFDVNVASSKTIFQAAFLDFADIAGFVTLPFSITGFAFFQANPVWFVAFCAMVLVAWLAASAEVTFGLFGTVKERMNQMLQCCNQQDQAADGLTYAILSFCFIDLPLGTVRSYFAWAGVEVQYLYLGKNFLCGIWELSICFRCICPCCIKVQNWLEKAIDMMPGADKVSNEARRKQYQEKTKKAKQQYEHLNEENENQKNKKTVEIAAEKQKMFAIFKTVPDLLEIIDGVIIEDDDDKEEHKPEVTKAFKAMGNDKEQTVTLADIKEGFDLVQRHNVGYEFTSYMKKKKVLKTDKDTCSTGDAVDAFLDWRKEEDGKDCVSESEGEAAGAGDGDGPEEEDDDDDEGRSG